MCMNFFKSELVSIFREEFILCFNIDYLYDTIGEDFNDLLRLFRSWEFNDSDLIYVKERGWCYLSPESVLFKKHLSFSEKLSYLPRIHNKLIQAISDRLVEIISEKINSQYIIFKHYCDSDDSYYHHINMVSNGLLYLCTVKIGTCDEIIDVWGQFDKIYHNNLRTVQTVKKLTFEEFALLDDRKIIINFVQHLFENESCTLNLEYIYDELDHIYGEMLREIKMITDTNKMATMDYPENKISLDVLNILGMGFNVFISFVSELISGFTIKMYPTWFTIILE